MGFLIASADKNVDILIKKWYNLSMLGVENYGKR